jgi:hypothetical protein
VLGIVVAEWAQGASLADFLTDGPLHPGAAARVLESITAAVEAAHHAGLVLGTDHPQRIRLTPEGGLRLAFLGPLAEATPREDVRGLGAILYLLLTGRWPLRAGAAGLPIAPTGPDGRVISPRVLRPVVPTALSTVAVRSLEDTVVGGIRTSAVILQAVEETIQSEAQTDTIEPIGARAAPHRPPLWSAEEPATDFARRRKLALGVTVLGIATVTVFSWIGIQVVSFFSDSSNTRSVPVVIGQSAPPSRVDPSQQNGPAPSKVPQPVEAATVSVYAPDGTPDHANKVDRVNDNNPSTTWKTDVYRQQFPTFKPGIGIMASFADSIALAKLAIDSPSAGTVVEIRTAPAEDAALADTRLVGQATLIAGHTEITLTPNDPTQYVLVWITTLSGQNGAYSSEIGELTFLRVG